MVHTIAFRTATENDVDLLRYWDEQPHVKESDPNDDWQWETELLKHYDWREQLIAELFGKPIGFVEIIDPALETEHYWGDIESNLRAIDIWIGEADELNKGYGTQMMTMAINRCFENPDVTAIINDPLASNSRAIKFYKRLGFKFVELRRFGLDDCAVHRLNRVDWVRVNA
jgi:aminoglycoside 6'-N-acetyltransferase